MPRIIYTDSVVGDDGNLLNTTPAATYATTDLSTILDNIASGEIQCGTGVPLDVNWNEDSKIPWEEYGPVSDTPWKKY